MKSIDLGATPISLAEALSLAESENLVLRTAEGREFVVAQIDDFDEEIDLARDNAELNELLDERRHETGRLTLDQVRQRLGLES